ncbi:BTAD domain-containing putative transcriptional regulator [Micromonospora echinaurantiaca]|uniref:BTAD domain-containing putative transcriptional regulator n=1 Tax=Micromonospora echinaurantiaca TaxID=47857 RepID=UPI0037B3238B
MVEPVSPPMTGSAGPAPTSPSAPADAPQNPADDQAPAPRPEPAPGVSLGSGSWLDIGLVAAILAAVALVWAHRRRRYTPRPPIPGLRLDDPTVAPMPSVITRIRRGLRRSHVTSAKPPAPDTPAADIATPNGEDDPNTNPDASPAVAGPAVAALASLPIGGPPAGLGLTGPGAAAAARGFLVSALAAGGLDEPNGRGQVIIPADTLATLLGAAASGVPDTPRLTVTDGLTDALTLVEEQTLHRTRACVDHEVDTVAALRDADPMAEPLPPLLLIADTTTVGHERARLAALLTQGQHLDIHGILLGNWPDGDTVSVADDGTTTPADGDRDRHGRHPGGIGRLSVIDPIEAVDLLRVIAESHTGEPPPPAPAEPTPLPADPDTGGGDTAGATLHNDEKAVSLRGRDLPAPEPAATVELSDEKNAQAAAAPTEEHDRAEHGEGAAAPPRKAEHAAGTAGRVKVQVLGDARVIDVDTSQPMRGKSLELLVYLAVRGGTASQEAILEDLLPEATTSKAPHRLHTYVYNLRRVLARTGGPATYLSHPDRRYILHRDTLEVDLWHMNDALDQANRATTPTDRIAALRRAVDAYRGPLADGKGYEWIDPYREAVARQAVDAAVALAEALDDQPGEALAVLTSAIRHHPYAEPLYQAAMRAHAALGDAAAIRDVHRQLARSLDEIDTEVTDDTTALAAALINQVQRHPHAGGMNKAPS